MMNAAVTKYSKVTSKDSGLFLFHGSTVLHSGQYGTESPLFSQTEYFKGVYRDVTF